MKCIRTTMLAIAFTVTPLTALAAPTIEEMWEIIQKQQEEIDALKRQLGETSDTLEMTEKKVEATADAVEQVAVGDGAVSKASEWTDKTRIGGYGEHHYNNFENSDDKIDAHRYVLYVGHQYSDTVRFFSEVELEHSLAGEGAPGEVELEQAFIEWEYMPGHSLVAGQFLIPVGILNETHEPETFYGVERNPIENRIIPTTWWETGAMLQGEFAPGLSYNFALHSGLKMDDGGTVRGGRQKSANATANDLAYTARLKYTGVPGLELAATYQYQENVTQGVVSDTSASLFEAHAVYQTGPFGLRALVTEWDIDGDTFAQVGRDAQRGWYVEPSFRPIDSLGFFVRYSSWDNEAGLAGAESDEVVDYGINYWLNNNVVFKADYQDAGEYNQNDSVNLGVGWSF